MFTCVASCSFVFDLGVKFKFGLAFALVLVGSLSSTLPPPPPRPSTCVAAANVFWALVFYVSCPSSRCYTCAVCLLVMCCRTVVFLFPVNYFLEDNSSKTLPEDNHKYLPEA